MIDLHIVTADGDFAAIRRKFSGAGEVRWVYLARDYARLRRLRRDLGEQFRPIGIALLLDETAGANRAEHVAWIDRINRDNGRQPGWWFGTVASRNVYYSNLFLYSCYLLVLQRLWADAATRPGLIVADSAGLAECVARWVKSNAPEVRIVSPSSFCQPGNALRPWLGYAKAVAIAISRYCAARFTKPRAKPAEAMGPCVVVDTFIHKDSISADGNFDDRYYPLLHEFLASRDQRVLVHPVLFKFRLDFASVYRRMRISHTRFIIQEDHLRLADYAAAFLAPLSLARARPRNAAFMGIDLDPAVREEHRFQDWGAVAQAFLAYRLWRRLRETGLEMGRLICWYENQMIDKALIRGARDAFPDAAIIGVQMFLHSPNFLNLYPSESEREAGYAPDSLLTTGNHPAATAARYAPAIPAKAAAALRYAYLFDPARSTAAPVEGRGSIVVLLPFSIDESLEMLDLLLAAACGPLANVTYRIKCHPDFSPGELMDAFGRQAWPDTLRLHEGTLAQALDQAAMVISSSSGSIVEAAVLGIPIIFIARQCGLNMNPLDGVSAASYASCYDSDQLNREITRLLALPTLERERLRREGLAMRDDLFIAVDDTTLARYLD